MHIHGEAAVSFLSRFWKRKGRNVAGQEHPGSPFSSRNEMHCVAIQR